MTSFDTFTGQPAITSALEHVVNAAKKNCTAAHHILLHGAPGLGKTTLSQMVADAMGTHMTQVTGPALQTIGDLATVLMNMRENDVLFIDECHAIPPRVSEIAYPAMQDGYMDVQLGPSPKMPIRIPLPPFTVVGATTRLAKVPQPLRDRFGQYHTFMLEYYSPDVLAKVLADRAKKMQIQYTQEAITEIAKRGRGTPRIAIDLLSGAAEYASSLCQYITMEVAQRSLNAVGIDGAGLNKQDREYLIVLFERFGEKPAGIEAIAAVMNTEVATLDSVVEPWLLRLGMIMRTPRGRVITDSGKRHLGV